MAKTQLTNMAEFHIFDTDKGPIGLDLTELQTIWSGETPGTTLLELIGRDPILVIIEFDKFIKSHLDYYDLRSKKKKPRLAKAKRGANVPYLKLVG